MINMPFERRDNRIRFTDTNFISHDQFVSIMYRFQYLGYTDFTEPEHVKEYLDRHTFLTEEQSLIILETLGIETIVSKNLPDEVTVSAAIASAVKLFGITTHFCKAGYVLPDGSMLDFSEQQPRRTLDHRSIHDIFPDADNPSECMLTFMSYGCARISAHCIDIMRPLTDKQKSCLLSYARQLKIMPDDSFYLDITNPNGNTVRSEAYTINSIMVMHELINDTDKYFKLFVPQIY